MALTENNNIAGGLHNLHLMLNVRSHLKLRAHKSPKTQYAAPLKRCAPPFPLNKYITYVSPSPGMRSNSLLCISPLSVGARRFDVRRRRLYVQIFWGKKKMRVFFCCFSFSKEPESIKKKNTHRRRIKKCERSRHREIIGSPFEMPIMVFVPAVEGAHSGSVTP